MGGLLVQILAARGLFSQVVLLSPAPPSSVIGARWSVLRSLAGTFVKWGFWKRPTRISFKKAEYAFLHNLPAEEGWEDVANYVAEWLEATRPSVPQAP